MIERRSFLTGLAILPTMLFSGTKSFSIIADLPTYSDLCFTSLQWAIDEGIGKGFGKPRELVIGFGNWDVVRQMLGRSTMEEYASRTDCQIKITVSDQLESREWHVMFDRGMVRSIGPS